jgi:hypothetical protein
MAPDILRSRCPRVTPAGGQHCHQPPAGSGRCRSARCARPASPPGTSLIRDCRLTWAPAASSWYPSAGLTACPTSRPSTLRPSWRWPSSIAYPRGPGAQGRARRPRPLDRAAKLLRGHAGSQHRQGRRDLPALGQLAGAAAHGRHLPHEHHGARPPGRPAAPPPPTWATCTSPTPTDRLPGLGHIDFARRSLPPWKPSASQGDAALEAIPPADPEDATAQSLQYLRRALAEAHRRALSAAGTVVAAPWPV